MIISITGTPKYPEDFARLHAILTEALGALSEDFTTVVWDGEVEQ